MQRYGDVVVTKVLWFSVQDIKFQIIKWLIELVLKLKHHFNNHNKTQSIFWKLLLYKKNKTSVNA